MDEQACKVSARVIVDAYTDFLERAVDENRALNEQAFLILLKWAKKAYGANSAVVGNALLMLHDHYERQGRVDEAEELAGQAREILTRYAKNVGPKAMVAAKSISIAV